MRFNFWCCLCCFIKVVVIVIDKEISKGIELWLSARKLKAVHQDDKALFESITLLQNDLKGAASVGEYPWETLMRGYRDREAELKISDVKET
jgi:hypothetical protein